ncbi:MAG: right-handed parallel beta-helix repeat-containing protein [Kiritimatiellae bacterium]|nr:right-handed parallel beta-helix repeat-containing protein [Kiritimatiellia bacterium]
MNGLNLSIASMAILIGLATACAAETGAGQPTPAPAGTYFVAPGGSDANPGTEAQPWGTLRKAAGAVQPGDTVRIRAGTYLEPMVTFKRAGTSQAPITFAAYGDGEVVISPSALLAADRWKPVEGAIYAAALPRNAKVKCVFQNELPLVLSCKFHPINSVDRMLPGSALIKEGHLYVWLSDGSHPKDAEIRAGSNHVLLLAGCDYTIFDGLTVAYGFNGFKANEECEHVTIRNCTIRSIASQGVQPIPADCLIEHCLFRNIGPTRLEHALYGKGERMVVRYNVFEGIAGAAIHQYGRLDDRETGGWFYGNVFRGPRPFVDPHFKDAGPRKPYYVEFILWSRDHNWVYNNVFYGEGKRAALSVKTSGNRILNNTFVGCRSGIELAGKSGGNLIRNNIFVDGGAFVDSRAGLPPSTLDHNVYHRTGGTPLWRVGGVTYASFAEYQRGTGGEANSRWADPRLVGSADAHLRAGSPAIDTGFAIPEVTSDKDGASRPQGAAPDIGAYEFQPGRREMAPPAEARR